jgi:hypothetical protein
MSTFGDLLERRGDSIFDKGTIHLEPEEFCPAEEEVCEPSTFADEQIRGLVRQVFFPGWPKPARQVVFSAVDPETDIREICMQVGLALASQVPGKTCVVEADPDGPGLKEFADSDGLHPVPVGENTSLGDSSRRISHQLWLVPRDRFLGQTGDGSSGPWLRDRLAELRKTFDYTVIHGPAAAIHSEATLLGSLCDGVVLVLEANSTRRVAAQKVKERLQSSNARLLGAILSQRTFPIPQALYRRL